MRSVVVVFPASMCAIIPMLRVFSSGTVLAISLSPEKKEAVQPPPYHQHHIAKKLPTIMRESAIGLRHSVRIFFLFNRRAAIVRRVDQFSRQFFLHRLF